jgi:glycosyltransferase involved in cell wall biosynthesis
VAPWYDYVFFVNRRYPIPADSPANVTYVPLPFSDPLIERSVILPWLALKHRLDLLHVQRITPPLVNCALVVSLHDILPLTHPRDYRGWRNALVRFMTPESARRADCILTVSGTTKNEIVKTLHVPAAKVAFAYNGIDHEFFRPQLEKKTIAGRFSLLADPYMLYLGALETRKNLEMVLQAFAGFLASIKGKARLIIAGGERTSGYGQHLKKLVREKQLSDNVTFTGFVSDSECLELLSNARLFLAPSRGEGFDIPPLEAMSCGVPVICSDIEVHRELFTGAAEFFPADKPDMLAQLMAGLWEDEQLRESLIQKGLSLAQKFIWENTARKTAAVYSEIEKMR